jgi:hypothetical protein
VEENARHPKRGAGSGFDEDDGDTMFRKPDARYFRRARVESIDFFLV